MADTKISALTAATLPLDTDADLGVVVQGGSTKQTPIRNFRSLRHPGYIASKYFLLNAGRTPIGTTVLFPAADTLYLFPIQVDSTDVPWKGLSVRVGSGGAGGTGAAMKCALWAFNAATLEPSGLPVAHCNAGAAATSSSATVDMLFSGDYAPTLDDFLVVGLVSQIASPQPTFLNYGNTGGFFAAMMGLAIGNSAGGSYTGWTVSQDYDSDISTLNISGGLTQANGITFPVTQVKT